MRKKKDVLWGGSYPSSDEGPAAGLLEDIGYRRFLDSRWIAEQMNEGKEEDVHSRAGLQVTARELAEKFAPIWIEVRFGDAIVTP